MRSPLSGSIDIGPVVNSQNGHASGRVVDFIDNSVSTPSRRPHASEFALQWMTDATRVLAQWSDNELNDGSRNPLG
jgi:hypothetical protein